MSSGAQIHSFLCQRPSGNGRDDGDRGSADEGGRQRLAPLASWEPLKKSQTSSGRWTWPRRHE